MILNTMQLIILQFSRLSDIALYTLIHVVTFCRQILIEHVESLLLLFVVSDIRFFLLPCTLLVKSILRIFCMTYGILFFLNLISIIDTVFT